MNVDRIDVDWRQANGETQCWQWEEQNFEEQDFEEQFCAAADINP
jgi:hypothetical protein